MTDNQSIKSKLIKQAASRLRKFGFIHVNENNITTDEVYSQYFMKILNEMLGENTEKDLVINQLLKTMNPQNKSKRNGITDTK